MVWVKCDDLRFLWRLWRGAGASWRFEGLKDTVVAKNLQQKIAVYDRLIELYHIVGSMAAVVVEVWLG